MTTKDFISKLLLMNYQLIGMGIYDLGNGFRVIVNEESVIIYTPDNKTGATEYTDLNEAMEAIINDIEPIARHTFIT